MLWPCDVRIGGAEPLTRLTSSVRMKLTLPQTLGAMLLALATACDPPSKPPEIPKVELPVAAPPKCESLDENCVSKSDTRARIPNVAWSIAPPSGWHYAQEVTATVAERSPGSGAVLAATSFDSPKLPRDLKKARSAAIERLSQAFHVTLAQNNVVDSHLSGVPDTLKLEGLVFSIWEQEGAKRQPVKGNVVKGNVVVLVGPADGRELLVLGFAPKVDEQDSQALVEAIQSLKMTGPAAEVGKQKPEPKKP